MLVMMSSASQARCIGFVDSRAARPGKYGKAITQCIQVIPLGCCVCGVCRQRRCLDHHLTGARYEAIDPHHILCHGAYPPSVELAGSA